VCFQFGETQKALALENLKIDILKSLALSHLIYCLIKLASFTLQQKESEIMAKTEASSPTGSRQLDTKWKCIRINYCQSIFDYFTNSWVENVKDLVKMVKLRVVRSIAHLHVYKFIGTVTVCILSTHSSIFFITIFAIFNF